MGVRDYFPTVGSGNDRRVHRECRECGENIDSDRESCPECDGGVAVYEL